MKMLFKTKNQVVPLIARLGLGIVMFPHGAQKMLGWFGGYGFTGTMGYFTDTVGLPALIAFLVIFCEFFGSIGLITGLLTRLSAVGIACVMLGAALMVHLPNGFFMNWSGQQAGEGFEYHLLALTLCVIAFIKGGGLFSLDRMIAGRE
ncbi:MAG: DoxX family protein [Leptospiraceae bacterium]|nr:DoxX family protein [Leptospiraceae bacterium]MCB1317410.1 DoxX family protein [Leptospiraceae bacterium]MCB1319300.1 DoxX family protein [Leptospiraceae bacterium]